MKRKIVVLLTAALGMVGASASYGQFGMSPIKRPNIANIFRPVVGQGAVYENTDKDGKKSKMEMSVVGKEMVGTEEGYWMEVGHNNDAEENLMYGKMLVTKDFAFHKMVFVMPGSTQPMEMDMDSAKSHRNAMEKEGEKWHSVGTETITVPAGTYSCEHWTKDDGKGDAWVSSKISPMSMVKSIDDGRTMVLVKVITDAKTHITGTPVKFDPQMMRQQMGKP